MGWSPFTAGRWTDWNGDQVWIPAEPFGYVTHHYGNWIYVRNSWYWAPPVVKAHADRPLLDIGLFWSPGRVSWISHDTHVGWVPLAPRETYYSHRNWGGPHGVVVTNNITRININIGSHAYAKQAIVVPRDNFYRVNNYKDVRVTNINSTTIINNYKAAPIVNNTVINNYTTNKERHNFTNVTAKEKPHNTVINRIEKNAPVIQKGKQENAVVVREQVKKIKEGKVNREARIETPKSTNHIVPAKEVNKPKTEINLQPREIKTGGKPGQSVTPRQVVPVKPAQPQQPAAKPERIAPVKPNQQEKPDQPTRQERVNPVKPAQSEKPAARPERVAPVKQNQQEKPKKVKPTEKVLEKSREVKPPEQNIQKTKEPGTLEKQIEKPNPKRPVQKQIEKSKKPKSSQKELEKRKKGAPPEEED